MSIAHVPNVELKELALELFKTRNITAEEAYDQALNFLRIKKDSFGRDIKEFEVLFASEMIERGGASLLRYYLYTDTQEPKLVSVQIIGRGNDFRAVEDYIRNRLFPEVFNKKSSVNLMMTHSLIARDKCKDRFNDDVETKVLDTSAFI